MTTSTLDDQLARIQAAGKQAIFFEGATMEFLSSVLNGIPDAIVVSNRKGEILLVNIQTELLTGYTRHELVGQLVELLIPVAARDRHVAQHRPSYNNNPTTRPMALRDDLRVLTKEGDERPVMIQITAIPTDLGIVNVAAIRRRDV